MIIKKKMKRNKTIIILIIILFTIFFLNHITASINKTIITVENQTLVNSKTQGGWKIQQSGTTQTLWGLSFTDMNTGTIVGESTTILRTTNAGEIWSPQTCSLSVELFDVSFSDEDTGTACGTLGTIIYTNNAGNTWITYQTDWMMQYYGAHMETSEIGVLVGENSIFSPLVTWTLNGWQTHTSKGFYLNNNEGELWDVHYSSSTTWYAAARVWTNEGAIARTIDGGSNWETIYWADNGFFGMDFPSDNIGYAVGIAGIIVKTTDGGNTWNQLSSGVDTTLLDVSFATDSCGTVVGQDGLILRTEDGGNSWISQESGTISDLYAVQLIDSNTGFAVGENGVILRTTSGGYPEDTEPPITTCKLNGTMNETVYISDVIVGLSATDNGSGVGYTMCKLDNGLWNTYTSPFSVSEDGQHNLNFYSVDNVGNVEQEKNCSFTIQHLAPPIMIEITGGLGIKMRITNTGTTDIENIEWRISVQGGILGFINLTINDTINNIQAGKSVSIDTGLFFGFGGIEITGKANDVEETKKGLQLFIFSLFK